MSLLFETTAEERGLKNLGNGVFYYKDEFSKTVYSYLQTKGNFKGEESPIDISKLAVFAGPTSDDDTYYYSGVVSDEYEFIGNGLLINKIRESIQDVGTPILKEKSMMSGNYTHIQHGISIQNKMTVKQVGDIFPFLLFENSYNGTKAAQTYFGIFIEDGTENPIDFAFRKKFGSVRQIHSTHSKARMTSAVGEYVNVFSDNMTKIVGANFNNTLEHRHFIGILDLIEKSGAERRTNISKILQEITGGGDNITSWDLFLAISRFSSSEKNINAKTLLDDMAERVLVFPVECERVLDKLKSKRNK